MQDFETFLESKDNNDTRAIRAIMELAKAAAKVFTQYSLATRKKAWNRLTSDKGQYQISKILKNPERSLNQFRKLIIDD